MGEFPSAPLGGTVSIRDEANASYHLNVPEYGFSHQRDAYERGFVAGAEFAMSGHLVGDCDHPNGTGVDHTPIGDPAKIWRCDSCGHEYRLGDDLAVRNTSTMTRHELVSELVELRLWKESAVAWMTKTQAELDAVRAERDELRAELEAQGYWLGDPA